MKSYDEITASVLQAAELRTIRIKRIRNACTLTAACLTCAIGGAAIMKLEKPTFLPEDPYESQTDSFYSASDPSTEVPTETTEETTVPPTETTTTTTVTETTTTAVTTQAVLLTTHPPTAVTELVTVYVQTEPAAIVTSIPGETHTMQTSRTTTTSATHVTESTETSETTTSTSTTASTESTEETDPVETTETTFEELTETEVIVTVPADHNVETIASTEPVIEETTIETIPDVTKPANLTDEEWQLLYDMYVRGELPFTFEFLKMPAVEETTEATTESLFPFPIS